MAVTRPSTVSAVRRHGLDEAAIFQNGHGVAQREDVSKNMRDIDDRYAIAAQIPCDLQKTVSLDPRQRSCRLIHDDEPGMPYQRPQDLDFLLFGHTQPPDSREWRLGKVNASRQFLKAPELCGAIYDAVPTQFDTEKDVVDHRQGWHQGQLLMNQCDAMMDGVAR